jgi:hypothetical protein
MAHAGAAGADRPCTRARSSRLPPLRWICVALSIALAQVAALGHWVLIAHRTCEHGLPVHVEDARDGARDAPEGDGDSAPSASEAEQDGHAHCQVPATQPAAAPCVGPHAPGPLVGRAPVDLEPASRWSHAAIELLLLAPKSSPPGSWQPAAVNRQLSS